MPYPDCILIIVPVFELDNPTVPLLSYPFSYAIYYSALLYIISLPLIPTNIYSIPALAGSPSYAYVYLRYTLASTNIPAHAVPCSNKERAEIKPGEHPYTRIKPLPFTNSHVRYTYITVTPKRTLVSVEELPLHIAVKKI